MAAEVGRLGQTGEAWTDGEIALTVSTYAQMLRMELRGERYSKVDLVRGLLAALPARSQGAVERKLQNVSAVLDESGLEWIDGFKPLHHYQQELRAVVLDTFSPRHRLAEAMASYGAADVPAAQHRALALEDVLVAPPGGRDRRRSATSVHLTGGPISALRDFRARALGVAGEEWVLSLERESLVRAGRDDLAGRVVWTARDVGDGAGYDIQSFRPDGSDRFIEVKTTNLGLLTPFYISRWEVDVSARHADTYSLYRVHGFARDPRVYVLDGSVEECARLESAVFLGIPIG